MIIIKRYKSNKTTICYISTHKTTPGQYNVCTGKPSDSCCLSWQYDTLESAEKTAKEYFENYTSLF